MPVKLTVITPSFNQACYLERTIRSVLAQRRFLHEYFVIDGGSTDGSIEVIQKYSKQIDWWVSEPDKGQSDAIRRGFQRASGDVIAWLNSDDLYLPGALESVLSAFNENPKLQIVSGYLIFIDSDDRILGSSRVPAPSRIMQVLGPVQVSQPTTFFKRELYHSVGGIDVSLHCAMDRDLWARFYKVKPFWGNIPRHIAAFRKHSLSKGGAAQWSQRYALEASIVEKRHPELMHPLFSRCGVTMYRAKQLMSGRHVRSWLETRLWRGKDVWSCFSPQSLSLDVRLITKSRGPFPLADA